MKNLYFRARNVVPKHEQEILRIRARKWGDQISEGGGGGGFGGPLLLNQFLCKNFQWSQLLRVVDTFGTHLIKISQSLNWVKSDARSFFCLFSIDEDTAYENGHWLIFLIKMKLKDPFIMAHLQIQSAITNFPKHFLRNWLSKEIALKMQAVLSFLKRNPFKSDLFKFEYFKQFLSITKKRILSLSLIAFFWKVKMEC